MQLNKNRCRSIDIFKGIAMIMVIMVHFEQSFGICKWFHYLQMGCPVFFVCSGFGVMTLIRRKYPSLLVDKNALKSLYISRYKSLAPGWYLAFFLVFLVNTFFIAFKGQTLCFGRNRSPMAIIFNLLFLHGLFPFCNNNVMPGGWFIGTLTILYCITPLILFLLNKSNNRKVFFVVTSTIGMSVWLALFLFSKEFFCYNNFDYFFFLVHYPNYLLGIMLSIDIEEDVLNEKQAIRCFPIGILTLSLAFVLFYSRLPFSNILSAWATALSTYLLLYYLITTEPSRRNTRIGGMLVAFGKNSYGIYLLHAFFAWPFIDFTEKIANHIGVSIINLPGFIIMIPVVLLHCYYSGLIFNKFTKLITHLVFK